MRIIFKIAIQCLLNSLKSYPLTLKLDNPGRVESKTRTSHY